ncbi:hypothetical protein [Vibrio parahaemolyticus]|uniref:hypothetical protein n=1 Tax=Vibrio parahaemolyticus TaxID=670 RepID=UPI00068C8CE7|nr:hypothetical protein [Vibrio parahaemolyticus]OQT82922.1 hypothetical protein EM98_000070 [Vibrio parahaemolyticus]
MNREEYTSLMIEKSQDALKNESFDNLIDEIYHSSASTINDVEHINNVIGLIIKDNRVRPEVLLESGTKLSRKVLHSKGLREVFEEQLIKFQKGEAFVNSYLSQDAEEELPKELLLKNNELTSFDPLCIDNYFDKYVNSIAGNGFTMAAEPQEYIYTDRYSIQNVENEQEAVVNNGVPKITDESNEVEVEEAVYPLNKVPDDSFLEDFDEFNKRLLAKYNEGFVYTNINKLGNKKLAHNEKTGDSYFIETDIIGNKRLTADSGIGAETIVDLILIGKGKTYSLPDTDTDFKNVVEAWTMLKNDGYDLENIQLIGDSIPERYHKILDELKTPGYVISNDNSNDNAKPDAAPAQPADNGTAKEAAPKQPENKDIDWKKEADGFEVRDDDVVETPDNLDREQKSEEDYDNIEFDDEDLDKDLDEDLDYDLDEDLDNDLDDNPELEEHEKRALEDIKSEVNNNDSKPSQPSQRKNSSRKNRL